MWWFVPYNFICCYNQTEAARYLLLVRITLSYEHFAVCHGCWDDQERMFSYKSRILIDNPQSVLWVVAYTEDLLRLLAALLMEGYAEYPFWYWPADIIGFLRKSGMDMTVGVPLDKNA